MPNVMFNQVDKLQHMLVGVAIMQLSLVLCLFFLPYYPSLLISFIFSVFVMGAKELIWDKLLHKGVASWKDFVAGLIGISYILITDLIIFIIKNNYYFL